MFIRAISAFLVGCTLLFVPRAAITTDRGPSTPQERKQALEYIHQWQAEPLGPHAKDQFGWVLKWLADVPDVSVHVCMILDKLPKGDKKDATTIFGGQFMAQTAFMIENPEKKDDRFAEYEAGVEGALRIYEALLQTNPKDREPYLDDLVQRREAGTLAQFVKYRAAGCKN